MPQQIQLTFLINRVSNIAYIIRNCLNTLHLCFSVRKWKTLLRGVALLLPLCLGPELAAQTWTGQGTGQNVNRWSGGNARTNWSPQTVPNAIGAAVQFTNADAGLSGRTIDLNNAITIGSLNISNTTGASFTILGGGGNTLTFNNSGSASLTLTGNSNPDLSGASIIVAAGNTFNVNHSGTGTLRMGAINAGANTVTFNNSSTGTTQLNGAITGTGTVVKSGSGSATLSGTIATGGLDIQGGTLLLAASNRISDSTNLTLSGGTLALGGHSDNLGTLTLNANSVIDFGGGDSVLRFADSSAVAWNPNATLTILNWNGKDAGAGGGGADQILFGSNISGLTAAQRSQIVFVNYASSNIHLPSGEVVPIPESATVYAGLGLLAFALFHGFRRLRRTKS